MLERTPTDFFPCELFLKLLEIEGKFKLQKCSACQDLQKFPTVENVRQLSADLYRLCKLGIF